MTPEQEPDPEVLERRAIIKQLVSEHGLDLVAVNTAKKNQAKVDKSIILFKETKTKILAENLTTEQYIKKIDAGFYDDGYAVVCERIRRGKYEGYKFIFLDIDFKEGVKAFLNTSGTKITLDELGKEKKLYTIQTISSIICAPLIIDS